jgi:ferric-dicitrate binding protein FerR (iron transport regulator)
MENSNRIGTLLFLNSRGEISEKEALELSGWRRLSPANEQLFQETINPDKVREGMKEYYAVRDQIFEEIKQKYPELANVKFSDTEFAEGEISDMEPSDAEPTGDAETDFGQDEIVKLGLSKAEYWESQLLRPEFLGGKIGDREIAEEVVSKSKPKKKTARIYRIARIAAIFIVVLGAGLYFLLSGSTIKPGTYKAELVSTDGVKTGLDDFHRGFLAGSAGIRIDKTESGELIYNAPNDMRRGKDKYYNLYTQRGGEFILKLSDGTMIWLNAQTSIKYPANFSQDTINISLEGEAYFELARNTSKHFIISLRSSAFANASADKTVNGHRSSTSGLLIESSGAHFNVTAYPEDSVIFATMLNGAALVRFDSTGNNQQSETQLLPGQQAKLMKGKLTIIRAEHTDEIIAWKNGRTLFHDADIQTIMQTISRWYDVDVNYIGALPDKKFNVNIPRDADLSELINSLKKQGVHISARGKKITVAK